MKKIIISLAVCALLGTVSVAAAAPSTVKATMDVFKIAINGQVKSYATNVLLYKGTTYVPVRNVASFFDLQAEYMASSKSVSFTQTIESNDWISLIDLQKLNKMSITPISNQEGAYDITSAGKSVLKIYSGDLNDGDSTIVADVYNKQIHVKKELGVLLLNKKDLDKAGFYVNQTSSLS